VRGTEATENPPARPGLWGWLRVVVGVVLGAVALGTLVTKAVHGGQTVEALRTGRPVTDAHLDDAYYQCIDLQAHSLVAPGRPVLIEGPSLGAYVTLLKAIGSWVTLASRPSPADVALSLHPSRRSEACLGTVVEARQTGSDGKTTTRVGTGASVPGRGPPPPPPL
jgi:hypothetical protein